MLPVKCLLLETGEVIIGFVRNNYLSYTIIDAQACIINVEEGQMNVNLAPWIPYAKEYTFKINKNKVISCFDARPQLEQNFKVQTGNRERGK